MVGFLSFFLSFTRTTIKIPLKHFIPQDSLLLLYHTSTESYFRYCNIIWEQCGEVLKDRLQTRQNKTARTIANIKYDWFGLAHCQES